MPDASLPLVIVDWLDSFGCSPNWEKLDQISNPAPLRCTSVGWLAFDGEHSKVIVPHLTEAGSHGKQGCGDMTIPTVAIVSMRTISQRSKEKPHA